jgi:hypothetical protein
MKKFLFIFLAVAFSSTVRSQTCNCDPKGKTVSSDHHFSFRRYTQADTIYILVSGQSNSNGYNAGNYDNSPNPLVEGWNGTAWVMLQRGVQPMGRCNPTSINSFGCGGRATEDSATSAGFYFAKRLQERTGKRIRVIFTGYGGMGIDNWIPEASANFTTIKNYMAAIGNPHIDYFIWDQGEADAGAIDTAYKRRLDTVVAQLDRQPFFGNDVPIFIVTVRDSAVTRNMYNIQLMICNGQYDQRYTLIDAGVEPSYTPSPLHYTAEGQYNIANKIIQKIYNNQSAINRFQKIKVILNGVTTTVKCGHQFSITGNSPIRINGGYKCVGTCVAKFTAVLKNAVTNVVIQNYPAFTFPWNYSFATAGSYKLEITPICGTTGCTPCVFYFTVAY